MNLPPISANRRRGQPIVALSGVLACWTAARVLAWSFGAAAPAVVGADAAAGPGSESAAAQPASLAAPKRVAGETSRAIQSSGYVPSMDHVPSLIPALQRPVDLAPDPAAPLPQPLPVVAPAMPSPGSPEAPDAARSRPNPTMAGGHQLMFMAALSMVSMPPELVPPERIRPSDRRSRSSPALAPRWSADSWVLLRRDGGLASLAPSGGSYGASQIGAVLRYRLDRASANKPSLYLRTSGALNGTREQDAAFGLSLRPIGNVPVLALAEARVTRNALGTRVRPAAFVVSEFPTAKLPLGLRGEAYVQAGYVGGKGASAFVDGQARIDAKLFNLGKTELRAGGAAWGGAQTGSSRLDLGPSASLSFRLEDTVGARLSADWRFRVAGRAAPSSGPALTLSAGF